MDGFVQNKETRNFHVRQLFYRVKKLLSMNVTPIFVLDGKAPDAKLATIASRLGTGILLWLLSNGKLLIYNGVREI